MKDWEELTAPPPENVLSAAKKIATAERHLTRAIEWLNDATYDVAGKPLEDRIGSFAGQIEDLRFNLKLLKEKTERGETE